MSSGSSRTMIEYPISIEWEISEDRLIALKNSTTNEYLKTEKFTVVHSSNVKCYLRIYPNGDNDESRGETWIFLHVQLGNERSVETECALSIESADFAELMDSVFYQNEGYGLSFCKVDELFDSNKKFIVDGIHNIKVDGIFKIENSESKTQPDQSKWKMTPTFRDLWKIGFEDFTVIADGKEIEVHKNVLASHSTVFYAMFSNSKFKEGIENKVEIPDFQFEVVEKVIKLCYQQKYVSDFSIEENAMFLKFADKYDIAMIKENLEAYLSAQITVSNLHEMVKIAEEGNSLKLRKRCLDFFIICLSQKEFVPNVELLDKEFFATAEKNLKYQKSQTF